MNTLFHPSWLRAWQGLHASGNGVSVRDAVLARYAESHRRYHTLQHLQECLTLFESVKAAADWPAEVEMALWFHDAVYALRSSQNEQQSANWAKDALLGAGVDSAATQRVHDLIIVTRHTETPAKNDEKLLVDIDLAILGATADRFAQYEQQIKEEYAFVPSMLFKIKRKAILQSFLERPIIYSTPALHARFESNARANLLMRPFN